MARGGESNLPDRGEYMTDAQYKGMLVDQKKVLTQIREKAVNDGNTGIVEMIDKELEAIETKLKF